MTRSTTRPSLDVPEPIRTSRYPAGVSQEPGEVAPSAGSALARGASRLNHVVYDQIKERLMEGRYAAGERLSAETLRVEFGVSKHPLMEALRRLSSDGLVEIVPQVS